MKKITTKISQSCWFMEMLDRFSRFATASLKATKKVESKYIWIILVISTSNFSVFIGSELLRKLCLNCRFSYISRSCTFGFRFTNTAGLKACPAGTNNFDPPSKNSITRMLPFTPGVCSETNIGGGSMGGGGAHTKMFIWAWGNPRSWYSVILKNIMYVSPVFEVATQLGSSCPNIF